MHDSNPQIQAWAQYSAILFGGLFCDTIELKFNMQKIIQTV